MITSFCVALPTDIPRLSAHDSFVSFSKLGLLSGSIIGHFISQGSLGESVLDLDQSSLLKDQFNKTIHRKIKIRNASVAAKFWLPHLINFIACASNPFEKISIINLCFACCKNSDLLKSFEQTIIMLKISVALILMIRSFPGAKGLKFCYNLQSRQFVLRTSFYIIGPLAFHHPHSRRDDPHLRLVRDEGRKRASQYDN